MTSLEDIKKCIERFETYREDYMREIRFLNCHLENARKSSNNEFKVTVSNIIEPCAGKIKDDKSEIIKLDLNADALIETAKMRNPPGRENSSYSNDSGLSLSSGRDTRRDGVAFSNIDFRISSTTEQHPTQVSQDGTNHSPTIPGNPTPQEHKDRSNSESGDMKD